MPACRLWRPGVKLETFSEAIFSKIVFRMEQCEAFPGPSIGFMSNKLVLGCKVAYTIDINEKTLHLAPQSFMMPILLLVKGYKKFSVIQDTSMLLRLLSYRAGCCIRVCTMQQTKLSSKRTSRSIRHMNTFNRLSEALKGCIIFAYWLLGRHNINKFMRHVHFRQEYNMVAC